VQNLKKMVKLKKEFTLLTLTTGLARQRVVRQSDHIELAVLCDTIDDNPFSRSINQCNFAKEQLKHFENHQEFDLDYRDSSYQHKCRLLFSSDVASDYEISSFFQEELMSHECSILLGEDADRGRRRDRNRDDHQEPETNPFTTVQGYGCFCSWGSQMDYGRGDPVDDMDRVCSYAYMNYQCLYEEVPSCRDFANESYFVMFRNIGNLTIRQACDVFNTALQEANGWSDEDLDCVQKRCLIDSRFIMDSLANAFNEDYMYNPAFKRTTIGGTFEHRDECPRRDGDRGYEMTCCGEYPERSTFPAYKWSCCENNGASEPYKFVDQACCNDGSVLNFGDPNFNSC